VFDPGRNGGLDLGRNGVQDPDKNGGLVPGRN
jgi:hypothetical protein